MGVIIISSDIISAVFLVILLLGSLFGAKVKNRSILYFRGCMLAAIIGSVGDAISYLTFDTAVAGLWVFIANMISYIMTSVMLVLFTLYFFEATGTRAYVPKWAKYPVIAIGVINILLVIIGTVNKKVFYVENGEVMDGGWTDYTSILMFLGILYLYYVLFSFRKAMRFDELLAFGGFLLFPIVDSWITLFNPFIDFTYPLVALAFVVIYVIIQEHAIADESLKKILYEEDSFTDPQTGFKNRRAYDEIIKARERGRAVGVVYCEAGRVALIREKDGSDAADEYVLQFDGILKDCFPGTDIYRVSENNFAVILYKISRDTMEKRVSSFARAMDENGCMVKYGYVYSDTVPLFDMVRDATSYSQNGN